MNMKYIVRVGLCSIVVVEALGVTFGRTATYICNNDFAQPGFLREYRPSEPLLGHGGTAYIRLGAEAL